MKLVLIITTLLGAVAAVFMMPSDQADLSDQTNLANKRKRSAPTVSPHAQDPEPPPLHPITPASLGISPTSPPTQPTQPTELITRAIAAHDLTALQSAALVWFEQDPTAARDWLASQATLEDLHPAISHIAARIGENGDIPTALAWAKILPAGTLRENTLFDIQALAIRNKRLIPAEISTDSLPPERIAELLSGAAGD